MKRYKTVDAYVEGAGQWQAELTRLRHILVSTKLSEDVKWGAPCYTYKGKNIVGLSGFKPYFGLWFHQGALLEDESKVLVNAQEGVTKALRQWRMSSAMDIKPALIKRYVNQAISLVDAGKQIGPAKKRPVIIPDELKSALRKNKVAEKKFGDLTPGRQREYADYIAAAKRAETKQSRLEKIMPMIRKGIGLNDKYRC
jgi:uncharacterized protein YdeI (YjbR/CyaY-like superfamily)